MKLPLSLKDTKQPLVGTVLPNDYSVVSYDGEYILATSPSHHQFVTWFCYVNEDQQIVTLWGNYFIADQLGGHNSALKAATADLEKRATKRRKNSWPLPRHSEHPNP